MSEHHRADQLNAARIIRQGLEDYEAYRELRDSFPAYAPFGEPRSVELLEGACDHKEKLAEYAHNAWSGWMAYMFLQCKQNRNGTMTIPELSVDRWKRQMTTEYEDLPESEKESDRHEAEKILSIIEADAE